MIHTRFDEAFALESEARDPLAHFRTRFFCPTNPDGTRTIYFCGNSLGLCPVDAPSAVARELSLWAEKAVSGHFEGERPWFSYPDLFPPLLAPIIGAKNSEVILM